MRKWVGLVCIGSALSLPGAIAQTNSQTVDTPAPPTSPAGGDARYSFNRVADGYLRLDSRTGQVALCSPHQVGWACQLVPEDRIVLDSEIARLQAENGRLKKELLSRGLSLPSGVSAPPAATTKPTDDSQASVKESIDRTLKTLSNAWTRFVDLIAGLTRDVMKKS